MWETAGLSIPGLADAIALEEDLEERWRRIA
jgi:hypothetical protein